MSQQTWQAIEDAVRAHVADESDGGFLTAWVMAAANADPANPRSFGYTYANSETPRHEIVGLLDMAHTKIATEDED